jgi:hypothetical protein
MNLLGRIVLAEVEDPDPSENVVVGVVVVSDLARESSSGEVAVTRGKCACPGIIV